MNSFSKLGVQESITKAIKRIGWDEPTPVQATAIPIGLTGKDLLVQAQTGTGKTGTFGSIILSRIGSGYNTPSALIITPTRELAIQVAEELTKMAFYSGHRCIAIYGGTSIERQAAELKKGTDIVVGTPGRLKDLLEKKALRISKVSIAVLDEADRMLDMGFAKDLDYILHWLPKKRQNMMFSATMPDEVKNLALNKMKEPEELLVSKDEIVLDLIDQRYMVADKDMKKDALCTIFDKERKKTIVFMKMKHRCTQLGRKMKNTGYNVDILHGDIAQARRERVIRDFKDDKIDILIATDVAARGLDIDDVGLVINYDMTDPETYVHRIGRTGRAGKRGIAYTFVLDADEERSLRKIARVNNVEIAKVEMELVHHEANKNLHPEENKKGQKKPLSKEEERGRKEREKREKEKKEKKKGHPESFTTIVIDIGTASDIAKRDIVEFIQISAGIKHTSIGTIDMKKSYTYAQIDSAYVDRVCASLSKYDFEGKPITAKKLTQEKK